MLFAGYVPEEGGFGCDGELMASLACLPVLPSPLSFRDAPVHRHAAKSPCTFPAHSCYLPAVMPCVAVAASQKCFWVRVVSAAAIMQIQLFCFNLFVPAYPLDCSRILANVLMLRQVEVNRAAYITAAISTPIGLAILGYGIWGFYTGGLYYSLNIFMAIFILYGTYGLWQAGYRGEADRHPMFAHYNRGLQQVSSTKSSQGGRTADFSGVGV